MSSYRLHVSIIKEFSSNMRDVVPTPSFSLLNITVLSGLIEHYYNSTVTEFFYFIQMISVFAIHCS